MKMYRVDALPFSIEEVEVESVDGSFVILPKSGRREKKIADTVAYFESWGQAHAWLVDHYDYKAWGLQERLRRAREELKEVRELKEKRVQK